MTLIVYTSLNEVIVTTSQREHETIDIWFTRAGRDITLYDREEILDEAVCITSYMSTT